MLLNYFKFFSNRLRLSRPWKYKIPLLIGFTYFFLLKEDLGNEVVWYSFLAAICTTIGFAGFGYLTNDLSDRKADKLAGKPNRISELSALSVISLFLLFCSMAILPWFYLPVDDFSLGLIGLEFLLFVMYAFPPFRLKEKGVVGLVTDALYAHVTPAILASWTFYQIGDRSFEHIELFLVIIGSWQLFSGVRNILYHQIKDHGNDLTSGTKTFVNSAGQKLAVKLIKFFLIPLELLSFLAFGLLVQLEVIFYFPIIGVFALWKLITYKKLKEKSELPSYQTFTNVVLDEFYIFWFPLVLLIGLSIMEPLSGIPILIAHCLIFRNVLTNAAVYVFRKLRSLVGK